MNAMELIRHRRSVRTFDGRALSREHAEKLMTCAQALKNPYDLPITWRLLSAKEQGLSSPVIAGTDTFIAGKLRRAPHAEEAFGFAFEKLVLYAESLGIGTTWIAGTMNRPAFERAMALEEGEVMPCVSPLGYPAAKMSLRETMMRKGIRADSRLDFPALFFDGSFERPLSPEAAGDAAQPREMVRWAPSAVNKQPWRVVLASGAAHFYEKRSKGYVDGSGWDLQKVDVGIALCHFACGLEEQGRSFHLTTEDPGLPTPEETAYIASYVMD
ncbi:MAG: nitroreductase [Clostridia bacterium]|nr:nitroreductase [Clostridia bacterium]